MWILMDFCLNCFYSYVIWRDQNECGYATRDNLFVLLEGKENVPDNVVDTLVLMIHEELLLNPLFFKKRVVVMGP